MKQLLREVFLIAGLGLGIGAVVGLWRGFPVLPPVPNAAVSATCALPDPSEPSIHWLPAAEAAAHLNRPDVLWLDVRSEEAYRSGHIAGAQHMPVPSTASMQANSLALLRRARTVITYDDVQGDCAAARRVATMLVRAGVADVRVLEGGMPEWLKRGYAAEAGTCRSCL